MSVLSVALTIPSTVVLLLAPELPVPKACPRILQELLFTVQRENWVTRKRKARDGTWVIKGWWLYGPQQGQSQQALPCLTQGQVSQVYLQWPPPAAELWCAQSENWVRQRAVKRVTQSMAQVNRIVLERLQKSCSLLTKGETLFSKTKICGVCLILRKENTVVCDQ